MVVIIYSIIAENTVELYNTVYRAHTELDYPNFMTFYDFFSTTQAIILAPTHKK